jgi:RNA polymerase sigma-70 factor (ECF subfamily)
MVAYAVRLSGDRGVAEDVVQEAFLRAWQHADTPSSVASPRGWLLRVVRNLVIDRARAAAVRPVEVHQAEGEPVERTRANGDHAQHVVDSVTVWEALAGLPPRYRDVLVEVYFRGKTMRQAAVALGVPEGTVSSRVYKALRLLRQGLIGQRDDEARDETKVVA